MKKVLLIITNLETRPYPVMPLGVCMVANALGSAYTVRVFDPLADDARGLTQVMSEFVPDYIGVSIRNIDDLNVADPTSYIETIYSRFIEPVRRQSDAPVILGGSGFSIVPEEFINRYGADYDVIGEGEHAFPALLRCLDEGGDPLVIPGVVTQSSPQSRPGEKLAEGCLASASRIFSWIECGPYRSRGSYPIQTKRGCAHRCVYCSYPCLEGAIYRCRSPRDIADEIEEARTALGDMTFEFVDSTFNDPPGHAEAVCQEIIDRRMGVRLRTMGINPASVSSRLLDLMLKAGFAQIDCTPDSASPLMLHNLGKNFSLGQLQNAAQLIRSYRIPTMWFFLFGGPGECDQTMDETFAFVDCFVDPLDMVHMTEGIRVFPGTDLYRIALSEGSLDAGQTMLDPFFYKVPGFELAQILARIREASRVRPNCVPASESKPDPALLTEAMHLQKEMSNPEPMFRTLLRIRRQRFEEQGKGHR